MVSWRLSQRLKRPPYRVTYINMKTSISMRELQKMSAAAIEALPHPMPIKNGSRTVAMLVPLKIPLREQVEKAMAQIDASIAALTPEQTAVVERIVKERGLD